MSDGEFELRNRHGDVIQRGEVEVVDVHEGTTLFGVPGTVVDFEFRDPVEGIRNGDSLEWSVRLEDV